MSDGKGTLTKGDAVAAGRGVKFIDLAAQYEELGAEIDGAIEEVIRSGAFAGGPFVEEFERSFAAYCGSRFASGVGSGTEALWLALLAVGVGPGDEVITVPNSFIATAEAVSMTGAKPVFVDVSETTYTMNPDLLEQAITPRTKAVIPVHLYGQMADMRRIMPIARRHHLFVIEDACQAHGAEQDGVRAGVVGDAGAFSFYPTKNLGAYGEGGAVVTNDRLIDEAVKMFRDHGQRKKYEHERIGWNCRLEGIQAAVLAVKLRHLEEWTERRREWAKLYDSLLAETPGLLLPTEAGGNRHVYHLYVVQAEAREHLMSELKLAGISCGIHYPIPIHLQKAYAELGLRRGSFPVAERTAERILSLPLYAELTAEEVTQTAREVIAALSSRRP